MTHVLVSELLVSTLCLTPEGTLIQSFNKLPDLNFDIFYRISENFEAMSFC